MKPYKMKLNGMKLNKFKLNEMNKGYQIKLNKNKKLLEEK